jgi:hypothetical protein
VARNKALRDRATVLDLKKDPKNDIFAEENISN